MPITEYNFTEENPIDRIFYGSVPISKAVTFLFFQKNGIVKQLLHHLKYKNQEDIGDFLGKWYGQILVSNGDLPQLDAVIPVPLHPRKRKKRGYNQVDLFAKQLAHYTKTPFLQDVLVKTANTKTQTKKNRLNRLLRTGDLFKLNDPDKINGKHILLVDDVITTGATLTACAKVLLTAKNVKVYVATMAFVP